MEKKRSQWGSNFGFLMAAIGSAVGLGNIWGFPYKMGANGGFAFLLIYIVLAILVGFVVMLGELTLGRKSGMGAVGTYQKLTKRFKWLGGLGVASAFLIMSFYSVLGGYCIKYAVTNIGYMFGAAQVEAGEFFSGFIATPESGILYMLIFMVICCVIVMGGIEGGIEKFSKIAMPALFVMLVVVIIRSVTLPGAEAGLAFMFTPNFEVFNGTGWITVLASAGGQMFFSLSLGMGCMITYGSYLSKKENLEKNSIIIIIADTIVALLAGVAVLPAAFALGGEDAALAGPKLLFITLQNVFDSMGPIGPYVGFLFYLLVIIAAITSAISLIEVITTFFIDRANIKREKKGEKNTKEPNRIKITAFASAGIVVLATIVAADGLGSTGMWQPLGFCWLDFMDLWSEGIMMPVGALLMCLVIGWGIKMDGMSSEIALQGNKFRTRGFINVCAKFVAPLILVFILLGQLNSFFAWKLF